MNEDSRLAAEALLDAAGVTAAKGLTLDAATALAERLQSHESVVIPTQLLRDAIELLQSERSAVLAKDIKKYSASGQAPNFDLNIQLCDRLKAVLGE